MTDPYYVVAVVCRHEPRVCSASYSATRQPACAPKRRARTHGRPNPPWHIPCPDSWIVRACCLANNPDSESLSSTCSIIPHIVPQQKNVVVDTNMYWHQKKKLSYEVKPEKSSNENDKYEVHLYLKTKPGILCFIALEPKKNIIFVWIFLNTSLNFIFGCEYTFVCTMDMLSLNFLWTVEYILILPAFSVHHIWLHFLPSLFVMVPLVSSIVATTWSCCLSHFLDLAPPLHFHVLMTPLSTNSTASASCRDHANWWYLRQQTLHV